MALSIEGASPIKRGNKLTPAPSLDLSAPSSINSESIEGLGIPQDFDGVAPVGILTPENFAAESSVGISAPAGFNSIADSGIDSPESFPFVSPVSIDAPVMFTAEALIGLDAPESLNTVAPQDIDAPSNIAPESAVGLSAPATIAANPDEFASGPYPLNHARILYDNLLFSFSSATATIESGSAGNAIIPNTYQRWSFTSSSTEVLDITLPAAQDMDAFGFGAHNLFNDGEGTKYKFYYSPDLVTDFIQLHGETTPDSNDAVMVHLNSTVSVRRLRLQLSASTIREKYIGYIMAGVAMQMPRPFFGGSTPVTDNVITSHNTSLTNANNIIGQSTRYQGQAADYSWQNITDNWYRANFKAFKISTQKGYPFLIAWNLLQHPDDVGLCTIDGNIGGAAYSGNRDLRSISFNVKGYL